MDSVRYLAKIANGTANELINQLWKTHICRQQSPVYSPVPLAPLAPAPHLADSLKSCNVLCAIFCVIKVLLATSGSRRGIFLNYGSMRQSQGLQPAGCLLCRWCFESGLINFDLPTPKSGGHPTSLSISRWLMWLWRHCNVAICVFDFDSCCMFSWHAT